MRPSSPTPQGLQSVRHPSKFTPRGERIQGTIQVKLSFQIDGFLTGLRIFLETVLKKRHLSKVTRYRSAQNSDTHENLSSRNTSCAEGITSPVFGVGGRSRSDTTKARAALQASIALQRRFQATAVRRRSEICNRCWSAP